VCGFKVDALWRAERLVVEVDSGAAHGTPARMEADRNRDLALRTGGYRAVRYTWHQLTNQPARVAHDLLTQLNRPG
jgi:very-short-patch-repair endonuclease